MKIHEFNIGGQIHRFTDKQWNKLSVKEQAELIQDSDSMTIRTTVTLQESEALLEQQFKGKFCSLQIPGKEVVYGIISEISFDMLALAQKRNELIIVIKDKKYTISLESLHECLKRISGGTI